MCDCITLEMSAGRLYGDDAETVRHTSLEFMLEVWGGDVNIGVQSIWVVFKAMRLDVITEGVGVSEKRRGLRTEPWVL